MSEPASSYLQDAMRRVEGLRRDLEAIEKQYSAELLARQVQGIQGPAPAPAKRPQPGSPSKLTELVKKLQEEAKLYDEQGLEADAEQAQLLYAAADLLVTLQDALFDCFNQACQSRYDRESDTATYNHQFLSAYEHAQDLLLRLGMIRPEQCEVR
jgi:hypothetical protein